MTDALLHDARLARVRLADRHFFVRHSGRRWRLRPAAIVEAQQLVNIGQPYELAPGQSLFALVTLLDACPSKRVRIFGHGAAGMETDRPEVWLRGLVAWIESWRGPLVAATRWSGARFVEDRDER